MPASGEDDDDPADSDADVEVHRPLTVHELQLLEEELRPLVEPPATPPQVSAANYAIGVADEIGRLILSFVLVAVVLIALAALITPWLWIAVAVWTGLAVWTILSFQRRVRRRKRPSPPAIGA